MISIECPNCGRRGSVPPDRLSSRLHCKSCNAVVFLDRTGQMAVDESTHEADGKAAEGTSASPPSPEKFQLSEIWHEISPGLKMAVPLVIVLALLTSWVTTQLLPEPIREPHAKVAEAVLRAVVANDRERALALADPPTAEDASRWFDLVRERFDAYDIGQDVYVRTTTIQGSVGKDERIVLMGTLASQISSKNPPMAANIHLRRQKKGEWIFDGTESLKDEQSGEAAAGQPSAADTPTPPPAAGKTP